MAQIKQIKTKRLDLESALFNDRSAELRCAIHEAQEFEWYFGIEETEERLQELSIRRKRFYNIFDRERNFLGYVGFYWEGDGFEVEIYILKKYRRRGYAKESLIAILQEAFNGGIEDTTPEEFDKIVSSVRRENEASRLLMKSCGFEQNLEYGMCLLFNVLEEDDDLGELINLVHYYITREMFCELRKKGVSGRK